jgi:NAD(P)-dependent dehydrogenase (short-subunit alcohol dehydrogenase family)
MNYPVLSAGRVAVVTGAAMGIGLAACRRFAGLGMRVVMADVLAEELKAARGEVAMLAPGGERDVIAVPADVARANDVAMLKEAVYGSFGEVGLMNNAATRVGGGALAPFEDWRTAFEVNFWGVVHGVRAFVPAMIAQGTPAMVVNTGSKQGITNPPGNLPYNVTKAALKTFTEGLQHELRNTPGCRVSAHLLVPGWTTTGRREHKPGAWRPDQVIDALVAGLARRLLHRLSRRRDDARDGPKAHPVGRGRPDREPAAAVALASRLRRGLQRILGLMADASRDEAGP